MNPNFVAASTKILSDQYVEIERKADDARKSGLKLPILTN